VKVKDRAVRSPPPVPHEGTVTRTQDVAPIEAATNHAEVAPGKNLKGAQALINTGAGTSPTHAMTGPSSWVAARLSPENAKRHALRTLTKLLDATPLQMGKLTELARTASAGGFGAGFAQVFAPHARAVLDAALGGSTQLSDLTGALELFREMLPPEAYGFVAARAAPAMRLEIAALSSLSDEIMKLPRGVDGRATQRTVDKVEGELLPRITQLRTLASVSGTELHALLAQGAPPDRPAASAGVSKALSSLAAHRKQDTREISVHVASRADAEAVLASWLGKEPLVDTSAMSPTLVKHLLGRARTFHWDDTFGKDGIITGHYPGSDHGLLPHLQIHTGDGQEVRVFFPKQDARTEGGA
jgi:hypothetical protein